MEQILWILLIVPMLPLLGFVFLSFMGKRLSAPVVSYLPTVLMAGTLFCSLFAALLFYRGGENVAMFQTTWLTFSKGMQINMGIVANQLTLLMIIVVSGVSFLVHLYSTYYMRGEERLHSYFAYLQLFTFSMLGLVLSTNLFQLYFFWELVGLSSFLLIGFYYKRPAAVAAANKAFIVTRFADFAMLIGILILGSSAGSYDFYEMIDHLTNPALLEQTQSSFLGLTTVSWGALLVFVGGAGKSALFPLHIWLPDAMEGPTPVSALIHAATMVVAGVFLIARLFPVYNIAAPDILLVIGYIGAFSYLFAAIIACVQTDFKKVLAYSTLSQIAFMFLALGVGGYTESMFHLFTHAFFKASLFLCAGVIIHVLGSGTLKEMGGVRKQFPITHIVFLIAALSISGFPFFSGFFSKESIMGLLYPAHPVLFGLALFTGGLSAFYMFRLYFLVFHHKPVAGEVAHTTVAGSAVHAVTADSATANMNGSCVSHAAVHTSHEPWQMSVPLIILGVLSIAAGYVNFGQHTHLLFAIAPVTVAIIGMVLAAVLYRKENPLPGKIAAAFGRFYRLIAKKFYIDEIYLFFARTMMIGWLGGAAVWCEKYVIKRAIERTAEDTQELSEKIKKMQSGRIQSYSLYFLGGIIAIILILLTPFMR
ncbi:MAG: NADH-quinone oxidoreductase subunit L [Bacteroidales bacterium]